MDIENQEVIFCEDDGEYRVCCDICDKLCIKRFYKNHGTSQTHTKNTRKRQRRNMQFKCNFFDIDMRYISGNICLKSLKHKKCLGKNISLTIPISLKLIKY